MTSRIHAILPRLAILLVVPMVWVAAAAYRRFVNGYVPKGTDIFGAVEGRWAWSIRPNGCGNDWHRISFSPDRQVMTITTSKPYEGDDGKLDSVAVYDIIDYTPSSIRGAIRGETRLTPDGKPVVWDLVLRGPDKYVWHRTDWFRGAFTAAIERCPAPKPG